MPKKDDAAARASRARMLRMQIERLVTPEGTEGALTPAKPPENESPAEFVERRMREIEAENQRKKKKKGSGRRKTPGKRS